MAQEAVRPARGGETAGVMKKVSRSAMSPPITTPCSSSRSVSAETVEWPKR